MITKVLSHNLAGFGKVNLYYWKYNSVKICNIMNKNQLTIFFDIIGNTVCTSKEKNVYFVKKRLIIIIIIVIIIIIIIILYSMFFFSHALFF